MCESFLQHFAVHDNVFFYSNSFLTDEFWRYVTSDYAAYPSNLYLH